MKTIELAIASKININSYNQMAYMELLGIYCGLEVHCFYDEKIIKVTEMYTNHNECWFSIHFDS